MAAAAPAVPPEQVALLEPGRGAASRPSEQPPAGGDEAPAAPLPRDRCQPQPSRRRSPEGGPQAPPREASPGCPPPQAAAAEAPPGPPPLRPPSSVPLELRCIQLAPATPPEPPSPLPSPKELRLPPEPPRRREPGGSGGWGGRGGRGGALEAVGAALGALLLCPCLLYGAFLFLPFDAPPLPTLAARLLYSLHCATFASLPIVLALLVAAGSELCRRALGAGGELRPEVEQHRAFAAQSAQLFSLFLLHLAVLASHLPQELLKLLPLLAALFAIARLISWLSYALGPSCRAFGASLSLLPLLAMLLWNLHSLLLQPQQLPAAGQPPEPPAESRARPWG